MLDIRTILFPTDFSPCSRQALGHALLLAEQHQATLHLFHAVVLHEDDPGNPDHSFPGAPDLLASMFEVADSGLAAMTELHKDHPVEIREFRERGVSAADLINEHAQEHDVDLIVMGTHGRRGPARLFLGSVAAEVVRSARAPVLSLRELPDGRPLEAIQTILCPVDFSDHSRLALAHATELARAFHAEVQVLHVFEQPSYPYVYAPVPMVATVEQIEGMRERATRGLQAMIQEVGDPDLRYRVEMVDGHPATEIVGFAERSGADLIVASSHGLRGIERLMLGSTCEEIVRRSSKPVFLVKPFGKSLVESPAPRQAAAT